MEQYFNYQGSVTLSPKNFRFLPTTLLAGLTLFGNLASSSWIFISSSIASAKILGKMIQFKSCIGVLTRKHAENCSNFSFDKLSAAMFKSLDCQLNLEQSSFGFRCGYCTVLQRSRAVGFICLQQYTIAPALPGRHHPARTLLIIKTPDQALSPDAKH